MSDDKQAGLLERLLAGLPGLLRNGEGPTVMLRADMDVLPIREDTGLDYASHATMADAAGEAK